MKKYIFTALFFVFFECFTKKLLLHAEELAYLSAYQKKHSSEKNLCVQTLNTYGMFYADNLEKRHEQLLQFLQTHSCDVVLLQEVWIEDHYSNLSKLSKDMNMTNVYFKEDDADGRNSGLVSLINGSIEDRGMLYFSNSASNHIDSLINSLQIINKGFGFLQMYYPKLEEQQLILVVNVHLHHLSQGERLNQLLLYLQWILNRDNFNYPIITAGDFNFEPNSLEYNVIKYMLRFTDPYEQMNKKHLCTFSCEDQSYSMFHLFVEKGVRDYIFFKSSPAIHLVSKEVSVFPKKYSNINLSDHYGVRAFFNITENQNTVNLMTPKEMQKRVSQFEKVLNAVDQFLINSGDYLSARQKVSSLREELKNSDSNIVKYLAVK